MAARPHKAIGAGLILFGLSLLVLFFLKPDILAEILFRIVGLP
jgi:hypothetical protein